MLDDRLPSGPVCDRPRIRRSPSPRLHFGEKIRHRLVRTATRNGNRNIRRLAGLPRSGQRPARSRLAEIRFENSRVYEPRFTLRVSALAVQARNHSLSLRRTRNRRSPCLDEAGCPIRDPRGLCRAHIRRRGPGADHCPSREQSRPGSIPTDDHLPGSQRCGGQVAHLRRCPGAGTSQAAWQQLPRHPAISRRDS